MSDETSGWRPIETAPKDGTRILGCGPLHSLRDPDRTYYIEVVHYWPGQKHWPIKWMEGHSEPTHWMPLPPAPVPA